MNIDIVNFYLNNPTDNNLPTFDWVVTAEMWELENSHNWCQRAFPNFEPSEIVPGSPVLDDETLAFIAQNCKEKVYDLVFKYLNHYDMIRPQAIPHNNRRVTRLLKFLNMLGYTDAMKMVYSHCGYVMRENFAAFDGIDAYINYPETINYWDDAMNYTREEDDSNTQ